MEKAEAVDHLYERLISNDGRIEMGIHPVLFGYRVRAGYVGDVYYHLDWCGGDNQAQVEMLYSIMKNILISRNDFSGIPSNSKIKPFYNDLEFCRITDKLITGQLESIKLKPLHEYRQRQMDELFGRL